MKDLDSSSAIVTGGASGLGAATVAGLVQAGARVVVVDRAAGPGSELATANGGILVTADVRDEDDVVGAVAAAERLGSLRSLVCCAGITIGARTAGRDGNLGRAHSLSEFGRVLEVNLLGTFNCIRVAATAMGALEPDEEGERGAIVLTASIAAFDGQVGQAAYAASKAGVVGMTLPIARDLAEMGVRVNTIAPGIMETPMLGDVADSALEHITGSITFPKRIGRPGEFADLALHLLTNRYLNGETVRLDGGVRMPPR